MTYPKINTIWKRGPDNAVIPGAWTCEEFELLSSVRWEWTEKVDGMNFRVHWDGRQVSFGGRTDNAQLPAQLLHPRRARRVLPMHPRSVRDDLPGGAR